MQSGWQRRTIDFTGRQISFHDASDKFKKKDEIRAIRRARLVEAQQNNSSYPAVMSLDTITA
jgi:hypothetical protein